MSRFVGPIPAWVVLVGVGATAGVGALLNCGGTVNGNPPVATSRARLQVSSSGAVFTTLVDGSSVNQNVFALKEDVYLDGGPGLHAPAKAAGLPEGDYFFQVTDPSGKDLLSSDHISCRKVHVNGAGVLSAVFSGTNYKWSGGAWQPVACQHAQGVDKDHSADGAVTVQLIPYDDTPNSGKVYKVWMIRVENYTGDVGFVPTNKNDLVNGELYEPGNFHGFVPSASKTDNFKAGTNKHCDSPIVTLSKFHDPNMNGTQDSGEPEISGWRMTVIDPLGGSNDYFTTGTFVASPGVWTITEDQPAGTAVTASLVDGAPFHGDPGCGGDPAAATGPRQTVTVTVVNDCSGETHAVVFGNVGVGRATGCKAYDRDGDGSADEGEPLIPGWKMSLAGTDVTGAAAGPIVATTESSGCISGDVLPGTYTITEVMPSTGGWSSTGPLQQTFTVESSLANGAIVGTESRVVFTNVCTGSGAFGTKGYWHNKNGLAEITSDDIGFANGLVPYVSPSSYFDAGDEPFDGQFTNGDPVPAVTGATGEILGAAGTPLAEISSFLVDANATGDPREQLAQQLLAFVFNTRHRLDDPAAAIRMPDGTFRSATDLITDAVTAWSTGTAEQQHEMEAVLDGFNSSSDVQFIRYTPCSVSYP